MQGFATVRIYSLKGDFLSMLSVKTPEEVMTLLKESFPSGITGETVIPLSEAPGG